MDETEAADIRLSAEALYADGQVIWDRDDLWNQRKRAGIEAFVVRRCLPIVSAARLTLNAGSGGERYSWMPRDSINSDLFFEQVRNLPRAVVGDVCSLPFANETFDLSVCVGSVLNYASLLEAIGELSRSLKRGGHLILHYESSNSFEQWFLRNWNASVARITTVNGGRLDKIWIYSPRFVIGALRSFGLIVREKNSFHIASAIASRLGVGQNKAAKFGKYDAVLKFLGGAADDQIILAEKVS
jgi:SAM-dependent methyltransferase